MIATFVCRAGAPVAVSDLEESATALLLRSPRLSVSLIMELLDLSDAEFRRMAQANATIRTLLDKRSRGELELEEPALKTCPGCGDWFIPYASARCCSDECALITRIRTPAH